jgi:hypothetical protein
MTRRLTFLLLILVVVAVCCAIVLRFAPEPGRAITKKPPAGPPPPGSVAATLPGGPGFPKVYDDVMVTVKIPPLSKFPPGWAEGKGCPHAILSRVLGAAVGPGGGVPVLSLEPDKPAAKAGIKVGDRLGERDACPSSLYGSFFPRKTARTIKWTVHRPKSATPQKPATGPAG